MPQIVEFEITGLGVDASESVTLSMPRNHAHKTLSRIIIEKTDGDASDWDVIISTDSAILTENGGGRGDVNLIVFEETGITDDIVDVPPIGRDKIPWTAQDFGTGGDAEHGMPRLYVRIDANGGSSGGNDFEGSVQGP